MHKTLDRTIAAAELLLIAPAALFMTALFVRNLTPKQNEPARTAQRIVMLYASSVHIGLWVMLIALPLAVFAIGSLALLRQWSEDATLRQATMQTLVAVRTHFATFLIAATTVASAGILAAIAVHVLTD
jgi:LPS O-antigen subunit length determinant protein (WzzB/FepE family)